MGLSGKLWLRLERDPTLRGHSSRMEILLLLGLGLAVGTISDTVGEVRSSGWEPMNSLPVSLPGQRVSASSELNF